jgi:hypothetical protein
MRDLEIYRTEIQIKIINLCHFSTGNNWDKSIEQILIQ